ncbi:DUF881 domain-containing protein [Armatimonas rosea]|uniref:Uncharacterized protein YlxW (UPF0749 family) n=1 Tax=Armatimonas rosea TaxID=685828 RepID=A0A7W9SN70_ARMRO|nr:DUF881 domain-containing protein [Armatimonas rosea]MBB6049722.1 uncharacterized protein YlxW (UPF0749 family) [Armatimonas rosea]
MSIVLTPSSRHRPWLTQITLLSTIMGGLLALSLKTQDRIRRDLVGNTSTAAMAEAYTKQRDENVELRKRVTQLLDQNRKYTEAMAADGGTSTKVIAQELQKVNTLAGLTPVTGPGVVVTLRDSKKQPEKPKGISDSDWQAMTADYLIHDANIRDVVNELKNAGAEAIAINGQRVVNTTAIRCVGNNVQINAVPTAGSPVIIKAIGDPDLIQSGLLMRGGIKDHFVDTEMVTVDKATNLTLPAFSGATPLRFAKPAPEQKAEQAQRQAEEAEKATGGAQ